jgi:ubiquitin C-terminal hydrolase
MYDLAGVVIHKGEISRGHYYSLSKDRDTGRWLCFDDKDVTYVDPSIISDRAYGG